MNGKKSRGNAARRRAVANDLTPKKARDVKGGAVAKARLGELSLN